MMRSVVVLALASFPVSEAGSAEAYTFDGHVYSGEPYDTNTPAASVTVGLWGDEDEWPEGGAFSRALLVSTSTAASGAFGLGWTPGITNYSYLHVIEEDPAAVNSTGARADDQGAGYVKNYNVVSFQNPPQSNYTGIGFWDETIELSGRVFDGDVGVETTPLAGVTVSLYWSHNPYPDLGTFLTNTVTDTNGWYGLTVSGPWDFYHILETDPTYYTSAGATTVSGVVRTVNWIEYAQPLDGKTMTGNKFWDKSGADLAVSLSRISPTNDPVPPGAQVMYAIDVWNNGAYTAANTVITFEFPPEIHCTTNTGGTVVSNNPDVVRWTMGDFPSGSWVGLEVGGDVAIDASGVVTSRLTAVSDTVDLFPLNNSCTHTTRISDVLSGRVFSGDVGVETTPLVGVTVSLYGANNPHPDPGAFLTNTVTGTNGWYGLTVSGTWEFYHIRETDPTNYTSAGATTVSGVVRTNNWIEYEVPLDGKTLTGNKFWDKPRSADLAITKTFSLAEPVAPGSYGHYTVRIENNGPDVAYNVVVYDVLPSEFEYDYGSVVFTQVSNRPPHDVIRGDLSFVTPSLPVELTLYGTIDSNACDSIRNTVSVSSDATDPNLSNNIFELGTQIDRDCPTDSPKWLQPPDAEAGLDIQSWGLQYGSQSGTHYRVADDWLCDGRPITALRWWGSYIGGASNPPPESVRPDGFTVRWYTDIAATETNHSTPGALLAEVFASLANYGVTHAPVGTVVETFHHTTDLGWMDPPPAPPFEHEYEYNVTLVQPWLEKEGTIYWLSVEASYEDAMAPSNSPWGWVTTELEANWNDDAVLSQGETPPAWTELVYPPEVRPWDGISNHPYAGESVNLAFALLTDVVGRRARKWAQEPDMIEGVDMASWRRTAEQGTLRADDFDSDGRRVSDIHWWGSYIGWQSGTTGSETNPVAPPAGNNRPLGFDVSWHAHGPGAPGAGANFFVSITNCHEVYYGMVDQYWLGTNHYEHEYQYYVDLLGTNIVVEPWDTQEDEHYWINIQAVFPPGFEPVEHDGWGWTVTDHVQGDPSAVSTNLGGSWDPAFLPPGHPHGGEPVDLAFELTTDEVGANGLYDPIVITDITRIDTNTYRLESVGDYGAGVQVLQAVPSLSLSNWTDVTTNALPLPHPHPNTWYRHGASATNEFYRILQR